MKVREVMTPDPVCCVPSDTAQQVARVLRDHNIGSVPVVLDQNSRKLFGMLTDRDLCLAIVAEGLDPSTTTIEKHVSLDPVSCRDGENLASCERMMQERQVRRVPIVDAEDRVIGIIAQADVALAEPAEKVAKTVKEVSKPGEKKESPLAA
jgi:CBS domain-containing protein